MSTAVAIQPAMPRPLSMSIAPNRPRTQDLPITGKENLPQPKPISSSPSFGATNSRSPKRERPCDACRRRKTRCVINEGAALCVLCEFHKQDCTFIQSPQPRKRKLIPEAKKDDGLKKRTVETGPPQQTATSNLAAPPAITTTPAPESDAPRVPPSQRISNALGETLGLKRSQHSRYIGLTTPFDPLLIGLNEFDTRNESTFHQGVLRKVNDNECFMMLPDESSQQNASVDTERLAAVERVVAPHGPVLVDLYFRVVHPSYPIVQKQLFLERLRSGDRSFSPALVAGIYVLALKWWSHEPRLRKHAKPDAQKLESLAFESLHAAMERPKLSTVQAGLLLLQRPESDSWSLTTQLVAIGQDLGLHLDCSNWSIPKWEQGLRKRIAWALYMQDKWSSLIHGRPSHIFRADWAVAPVADEDFSGDAVPSSDSVKAEVDEEEKADYERGQALFSRMITLTEIMAEVMDTFYTQVAIQEFANAGKESTRLILDRAKPVQIKLKDWFAKLPDTARMDNPEGVRLSSTGYLHLAYFATEITLHRRIVQSLDPKDSDSYVQYICRSAAKTRLISAMDFVNRLKPGHLQAFWFFASKINFTLIGTFGSLLYATSPHREEAEFYKMRLREYRWTLSVSSGRARFLDYAVRMLDSSRAMISKLADKPALAQLQSQAQAQVQRRQQQQQLGPSAGTPAAGYGGSQHMQMLQHRQQQQRPLSSGHGNGSMNPPTLMRFTANTASFSGFRDDGMDVFAQQGTSGGSGGAMSETSEDMAMQLDG